MWYEASQHADHDRRAHERLVAHELDWLKNARLRSGQPSSLIDISAGGALFETSSPLGPGSTGALTLTGEGIAETANFRLLRCEVSSLTHGLVFRGACVFDRVLRLPPPPAIGAGGRTRGRWMRQRHQPSSWPAAASPVSRGGGAPRSSHRGSPRRNRILIRAR